MKDVTFEGLVLGPKNTLIKRDHRGPPDCPHWTMCTVVWATSLIMRNCIDWQTARAYKEFIQRYAAIFVQKCGPLLYQAETRMRREGFERIRQDCYDELDDAIAGDPVAPSRY